MEYKILSETTADVFAKVNVTKFVTALEKENCDVLSMQEHDESLESYYVSLIGGGKNA
jgi:ABC-2 type transport system ATP-binding protein